MKKTILVTGAHGFLGKNLQDFIKAHKLNEKYNFLFPRSQELNLLKHESMEIYFEPKRIDIIVHMAAKCGGILANKNAPAAFLRDNTQMALNVFEIARQYNVQRVYSLGTVCSYPKFLKPPFKEENLFDGKAEETNFPYGQAKRTLLMLGQTYSEQYGIGGAHLIPANMYGYYDHFDLVNSHVIPALINKFSTAKAQNLPEVFCWGTGGKEASREFLFAEDCCSAILAAIENDVNEIEPINIGTGKEIYISELATSIADLVEYTGKITFTGEVSNGQPRRSLDISRAKKVMNWKAKTNLQKGLKKTLDWYLKLSV